ncbi:hypothetical protein M0811_09806 [Anaeramoeba ignava]|uniref:BTB domain-containing protein n=1 Tax=Anaeramoeba ignava TaxID=1746090 RepID=A0A9Q0R9A5_ANAIG|nr:hypothetical protein M0811_09806 [Anaeramoeba ignava]
MEFVRKITCEKIKTENNTTPRSNQSSCFVDGKLYTFGGRCTKLRVNTLDCFDFETKKWTEIECKGVAPEPRSAHTLNYYNNKLYVFGGLNKSHEEIGDLFCFDLKTKKWERLPNCPVIICDHAAVFYGPLLICYGSEPMNQKRDTAGDILVFDTNKLLWSSIATPQEEKSSEDYPKRLLTSHTLNLFSDSLYLYGGTTQTDFEDSNCLFKFDLLTRKWSNITDDKHPNWPISRFGHTICNLFDNLILFSGFHSNMPHDELSCYDFHSNKWFPLKYEGDKITARLRHNCVIKSPTELVIFGGFDNDYLEDIYVLKFHLDSFLQDLVEFLQNQNFCDSEIISRDHKKIKFHKVIIESRLNGKTMNDFISKASVLSANAIQYIIEYLYTGILHSINVELQEKELMTQFFQFFSIEPYAPNQIQKLKDDFTRLYDGLQNDPTTNFTLKCEDQKFHVHQEFLALRSGLFRGMFECVTDSSHEVSDYSQRTPAAIQALLRFIYTDKIDHITQDIAFELIDAIEFYDLNPNSNLIRVFEKMEKEK